MEVISESCTAAGGENTMALVLKALAILPNTPSKAVILEARRFFFSAG